MQELSKSLLRLDEDFITLTLERLLKGELTSQNVHCKKSYAKRTGNLRKVIHYSIILDLYRHNKEYLK